MKFEIYLGTNKLLPLVES